MSQSTSLSEGIRITVTPEYDLQHSNVDQAVYVYRYTIKIENTRSDTVQLLERYWLITDGFNRQEEVSGPGVVGKTPVLNPGESFEYSSYCPLATPLGVMEGFFRFENVDVKSNFEAKIAPFSLRAEHLIN